MLSLKPPHKSSNLSNYSESSVEVRDCVRIETVMKKEQKAATQLPVPKFLRKAWEDSRRNGTDKMTDEAIQAEIRDARREKRLKDDKSRT